MSTTRGAYPWQESYFEIFSESKSTLVTVRIYEAIAAIEQRQISPVLDELERVALLLAEMKIRKLIAEGYEDRL